MSAPAALIHPRFGLVRRVVRQPTPPELPAAFVAYSADVADTRRFAPWIADRYAFGATLGSDEGARDAALGEAVERYCANAVPHGLRAASYLDLLTAGEPAVDPAEWVLYSSAQYATSDFPFVPMTADLRVRWVEGRDLASGRPVLVPASLAYLNFRHPTYASEPPTNGVILPGIAAGRSREDAERAAIAEIVERDAVTLWWQRNEPAIRVRWQSSRRLQALLAPRSPASRITYEVFAIPSEFGAPVIGALLDDPDRAIVTMGSACRADPLAAIAKALTEAIQLRAFSVDLLDADSRIWRGARSGLHDQRCFFPYRADRSYLDCVTEHFAEAEDFATHAQLYLDRRMREHLERITAAEDEVDPSDLPRLAGEERGALLRRLAECGRRVVSVDVTTSDVAATGLRVVRVLVPGLYPNAPAAFPFHGGSRLCEPAAGGARLTVGDLVRAPIPAI
jgi:ribosomal protein S12 methylthiotransferase accessory factor